MLKAEFPESRNREFSGAYQGDEVEGTGNVPSMNARWPNIAMLRHVRYSSAFGRQANCSEGPRRGLKRTHETVLIDRLVGRRGRAAQTCELLTSKNFTDKRGGPSAQ
jgi:hypothetical protein